MKKEEENNDFERIKTHWIESSDRDFISMNHFYDSGDYHWALFVGHLVLEKLLKALYWQKTHKKPFFIHDLLRLSGLCGIETTSEIEDYLDKITAFNINTRYQDYKLEFYKRCTKEFAENWIKIIGELRVWIKTKL